MKSLEKQLLTGLTLVLVLILVGQLIIANLSTRNILSEFVSKRLELDAKHLLHGMRLNKYSTTIDWKYSNPEYDIPNSGYYYIIKIKQTDVPDQLLKSNSLQNYSLPFPKTEALPITQHDISGPKGQHLISWTQNYTKNGLHLSITVAENMDLLVKQRKHFSFAFISIGMIGLFMLLALQRYVIRRLFRHLDHSRNEIKEIEAGERKSLSESVPSEIYPLVKEFNHSLSLMQDRLERSRNSLGNLAHALKTPLSILIQNLDADTNKNNKQMRLQTERIRQLMERELKRARIAGLGNSTQRFEPRQELNILSDILKQAHKRPDLNITFSFGDDITSFGDREDMLELFGNLLDNACKWAKNQVYCSIKKDPSLTYTINIEDDGNGQAPEELLKLTNRGERIDEMDLIEGYGLGLSICKDIVKLYGGEIHFHTSSKFGGLQVKITLPII